jgi:hypothetical protein
VAAPHHTAGKHHGGELAAGPPRSDVLAVDEVRMVQLAPNPVCKLRSHQAIPALTRGNHGVLIHVRTEAYSDHRSRDVAALMQFPAAIHVNSFRRHL